MLAQSDVRFENDFVGHNSVCQTIIPNVDGVQRVSNTLAGEAYAIPTHASLPDVVRDSTFDPTEPKPDVTMNSMNSSKAQTVRPPKPVYTVLTSKNKLHPTQPDVRSSRRNELSNSTSLSLTSNAKISSARPNPDLTNTRRNELSNSTMKPSRTSAIHTTPAKSIYAVPSNTVFSSARFNPDPINTGPSKLSKPHINPPTCYRTNSKFQSILPKPKILYANISVSPARPKSNSMSPILYQLLKRNIPSTTSASVTSKTPTSSTTIDAVPSSNKNTISPARPQPNPTSSMLPQRLKPPTTYPSMTLETPVTSPNPIDAVPTPNTNASITSCAIQKEDHFQHTRPLSNSGLNTIPKSSYTKANPSTSQIQQKSSPIVPSTELPQSSTKHQDCCTKSVMKASTLSNNRTSITKQAESCIPPDSSCDGSLSDVKVELARQELWKLFYDQGNEMIVSKNGRYVNVLVLLCSGFCTPSMDDFSYRLNFDPGKKIGLKRGANFCI